VPFFRNHGVKRGGTGLADGKRKGPRQRQLGFHGEKKKDRRSSNDLRDKAVGGERLGQFGWRKGEGA